MLQIIPPTTCPSCDSHLAQRNFILYCEDSSCGAKIHKRIEHFAKALKIKGLGPSMISKLNLNSVDELYTLEEDDIFDKIGSKRLAYKVFLELERSKSAPLNVLLPAFSIPLIGNTAAEKLAKVCKNIHDIDRYSCDKAGLGPKATESLTNWIVYDLPFLIHMPFSFDFEQRSTPSEVKGIVCISGRLKSYKTKAEASDALAAAGYTVKSSITKDVTILVNESGVESAKTLKARESGTQIVINLKDFIGE